MSSKRKGGRRERQARELLEEKGYEVEKAVRNQFNNNDFFNLYDLIAVKPGEKIKFVQVKSNGTGGALQKTLSESADLLPLEHAEVEFWICYDREGWRVLRMRDDWHEIIDERDKKGKMGEYLLDNYK